jgi:metal-responsive CopG/Arc/MetJ family transcriptional regulator
MAKVMVSLPDDLLHAVDTEARRRGTTRSGLLRDLAEDTLQRRAVQRAQRMRQIRLAPGERRSHGGGVAELVKTHRPRR